MADTPKDPVASPAPPTAKARASAEAQVLNSIQPVRRRSRGAETVPLAPGTTQALGAAAAPAVQQPAPRTSGTDKPDDTTVPQEVRDRFARLGRHYHFPDGALAFTDKGTKLLTSSENTEVVRALAAIAQARGWQEISVKGTEAFRREAWASASVRGIGVRGYTPTQAEQVRLVQRVVRLRQADAERDKVVVPNASREASDTSAKSAADSKPRDQSRTPEQQSVSGTLLEHGAARYQGQADAAMSYFVKLQTPRGERMVWGVDLERAIRESLSRPKLGDEVTLRSVRREPVTVKTIERNETGEDVPRDLTTHRNRWQVESRSFVDQQKQAADTLRDSTVDPTKGAGRHPELVSAYVHLRGAELLAKERLQDPQKRGRFLSLVRNGMADILERGQPLKPALVREPPVRTPPNSREDGPGR